MHELIYAWNLPVMNLSDLFIPAFDISPKYRTTHDSDEGYLVFMLPTDANAGILRDLALNGQAFKRGAQ